MDAGTAAVVAGTASALLAGGAAITGAYMTARSMQHQAVLQARTQVRESRRQTYAEFVQIAQVVIDVTGKGWEQHHGGETAYRIVNDIPEEDFIRVFSQVALEGPDKVVASAERFLHAISEIQRAVWSHFESGFDEPLPYEMWLELTKRMKSFVVIAREACALGTD